jgi:hypothetical protein
MGAGAAGARPSRHDAIFAAQETANTGVGFCASGAQLGMGMRFSVGVSPLSWVALALANLLVGCTSNDSGELLIDPGRYAVYKCDDLAARWKVVLAREKELRDLMDKASQTASGAVIGSLAYRAQYDATVSDQRLLQRTAAEKNCGLSFQAQGAPQPQSTQYQSDQSIR